MAHILNLKHVVRGTVASVLLLGAQLASAQFLSNDVGAGSVIKLTSGSGPFNGTVTSGPSSGSTFESFCLEEYEYFSYGQSLYVKGVTNATTNAAGGHYGASTSDPLSFETAWLFTKYSQGAYGNTSTVKSDMQNAFWHLEGEKALSALSSNAKSYVSAAQTAVTNGYTGYGNVRVLNLYTNAAYTNTIAGHAQDQLVMLAPVPEPETYAMLLAGLGLMGFVARRRKQEKPL